MTEVDTGITSKGNEINWKALEENRRDDPKITQLVREGYSIITNIGNKTATHEIDTDNENFALNIYIDNFNKFLKEKGLKFSFDINEELIKSSGKESKKVKKLSKKEEILLQKFEKDQNEEIKKFLKSLIITNHYPSSRKNPKESFFNIIYWTLYLCKNKTHEIDNSIFLDCSISLYRAIEDSKYFLTESIIAKSEQLLADLENIIKNKTTLNNIFKIISEQNNIISNSYWDKEKPVSIKLYDEQKRVLVKILESLLNNEPLLYFYKVPPANGKTLLSIIIAKGLSHINSIKKDIVGYKNKILLYLCPNSIVRNEVAELCIAINVDIKFWIARTRMDNKDGKIKTLVRPHKFCYAEWGKKNYKKRSKEDDEEYNRLRYSDNLTEQVVNFLNLTQHTRSKNFKISDINDADNLPEMIIADLESAYRLLAEFPDLFIPYYDETFAASELPITTKIMSILPRISVLVSATLAEPHEIPSIITNFRNRHSLSDDTFVECEKSNIQQISCTFIDQSGNIFFPHQNAETFQDLDKILNLLDNEPLIQRGYSPEVVFIMSKVIDSDLPIELKFNTNFPHYGQLTHTSLRNYGIEILRFILNSNDLTLLQRITNDVKNKQKIRDLNIENLLGSNAIHFHMKKTLHIGSSNGFDRFVKDISRIFLDGSPKLSSVISNYERLIKSLNSELESTRKVKKDTQDEELEILKQIDSVRMEWPAEFLLNSVAHASKFGNGIAIKNPNTITFGNIQDLSNFDELYGKLFVSGIGIYEPENASVMETDIFLKYKNMYKEYFLTEQMIFGINLSQLCIVDVLSTLNATKNTLYQLCGRAGRDKNGSAMILLRDTKFIDLILDSDTFNIEAQNIENNYALL